MFMPADSETFTMLLDKLYAAASSESYIRDIELNMLLTELIELLFQETVYEGNGDSAGRKNLHK